jgi:pilus biogenesis lipoprotein CpaD
MTRRPFIGLLLLLGGCQPVGYWDGQPTSQRVEASDHVSELTLSLDATTGALTYPAAATLRAAVAREQARGTVSLDVVTRQGADGPGAVPLLRAIETLGIPSDRIRQASAELRPASALVRIHSIQVKTPPCAGVPPDSVNEMPFFEKQHYVLGCATAANFATMLADPRDLTAPPAAVLIDGASATQPIDSLRAPADKSGKTGTQGAGGAAGILAGSLGASGGGSQ